MKHCQAYLNKLITCLDAVCFLLLVEKETAINYVVGERKKKHLRRDLKSLIKPLDSLKMQTDRLCYKTVCSQERSNLTNKKQASLYIIKVFSVATLEYMNVYFLYQTENLMPNLICNFTHFSWN